MQRSVEILRQVPRVDLDQLGGFWNFKVWVSQRFNACQDMGRKFGLRFPRGCLLVGHQGTGKTLAAKAIAKAWDLPLYHLDMGSVYGSYLGQSEERMRKVFSEAEAEAPCVIWIDELEKGVQFGGGNDNGVSGRVIASLLTWLQEREKEVFISATANSVESLPPELIRPGRFDRIWGVELPDREERIQIMEIHLISRKRDPENFNLSLLADSISGYTGAEIETAIDDALYLAFSERSKLTGVHVLKSLQSIIPGSRRHPERFEELRGWMRDKSIPV